MSEFDQNTDANENSFVVDVDAIQEATRENLPQGWYNCICEEHDFALSQSSGQPMWSTKWRIEDGQYANRVLFQHFSWSEKAAPYTKANVMKFAPEVFTNPAYRDAQNGLMIKKIGDEAAFVSKRAQLKVGFQNYEGEKRNTVKDIRAAGNTNEFLSA